MQVTEIDILNPAAGDGDTLSISSLTIDEKDAPGDGLDGQDLPPLPMNDDDELSSPTSTPAAEASDHSGTSSVTSYEQDGSPRKSFEVCQYPGKGLGLRATEPIFKDAIIWSESPAITCPSHGCGIEQMERILEARLHAQSEEDQQFVLHGLTDVFNYPNAPLTGRLRTNSLPCGRNGKEGAVFKVISLANHNCIPNAEYYWDHDAKQGVIFAVQDIAPGDEITIMYIEMAPTKQRQTHLQELFRFSCQCELCTMSKKRRREQDRRVKEITILKMELFSDPYELRKNTKAAFEKFQRLAVLYADSELEHEREMDRLWAAIADLCVMSFDKKEAMDTLLELTDIHPEAAREVVNAWYAEYEDQM